MNMSRPILALLVLCGASLAQAKEPSRLGVEQSGGPILYSTTSSALAARETAGPDTFAIFGGPDAGLEGKFQDAGGLPDLQGWTSFDLTDAPTVWQVSTFNAENLNGNGPGNHALWCGQDATQQPDWVTPPGYGNNWEQEIRWMSPPVADPGVGQTVTLDFAFNIDLEPGFDFLIVAYEANGTWNTVYSADGALSNERYGLIDPGTALPIEYGPNSYAGSNGDRVHLRILVSTDGGWSDEDGDYDSSGALQIDDISIEWSGGSEFEDFEGPGPYLFEPQRQQFFGDFASVLTLLTDVDPCRSNPTPGLAFIDFGQTPANGPNPDGVASTGGSTDPNIEYGIPGHYVVNSTGGLTFDDTIAEIDNRVMSPEIPWNLPGAADDGDEMIGAMLCYDVWDHLPNSNLIGAYWDVRSRTVGGGWGPWMNRGFIYLGDPPVWERDRFPVGDLLMVDGTPDFVQFRLGVYDLSSLSGGYYGLDASTPAPVFDNVALLKYRVDGPALSTRDYFLANDGFPRVPVFDVSTQAARDQQDVAFDMVSEAWPQHTGILPNPGDSVVVDVTALIPGTSVTDIRMVWALQKNPVFEDDIRTPPSSPLDENVVTGAQLWSGEVVATEVYTQYGNRVANRWHAEVPDVDFLYPGDVLHYYFRATDNQGRVTTLPDDTTGFLDFGTHSVFDRTFTVRALPSVQDPAGSQPGTLVIYDADAGHEETVVLAFRELGAELGFDLDMYRVQAARARYSNGIGAFEGHGANVSQVSGYENILYLSGTLLHSLSDGTDNSPNDKGDDIGLIEGWAALPGPRRIAYFGDSLTRSLEYYVLASLLGVDHVAADVGPFIGDQMSPRVAPAAGQPFLTEFVAGGGCQVISQFDHIVPTGGATSAWEFLDPSGVPIAGASAAVLKERANGFDITFPIAFERIWDDTARQVQPSARARLLDEIFGFAGYCPAPCTDAIPDRMPARLEARPNPFNPRTVVSFTAADGSRGSVRVYSLRGELVRTLHEGEFRAQEFVWDGADGRGAAVASGVYLVRATDGRTTRTLKVALVR